MRSALFVIADEPRSLEGSTILAPQAAERMARALLEDIPGEVVEIPRECGDTTSEAGAVLYEDLIAQTFDLIVALDKLDFADASFSEAKDAVDRAMLSLYSIPLNSPTPADTALIAENARDIAVLLEFHTGHAFELDKAAANALRALRVLGTGDSPAASGSSVAGLVEARMVNWRKLVTKLRFGLETRTSLLDAIEAESTTSARGREGVVTTALAVFGAALGLGFVAESLAAMRPDVLTTDRLRFGFQLTFILASVLGFLLSRVVGQSVDRLNRDYRIGASSLRSLASRTSRPWFTRPALKTLLQLATIVVLPLALVVGTSRTTASHFDAVSSPREETYRILSMVRRDGSPTAAEGRLWAPGTMRSSRARLRAVVAQGVFNILDVQVEPPYATTCTRIETGNRDSYGFVVLRWHKVANEDGGWRWVLEDAQTVAPLPGGATIGTAQ